jgi:hypothetical protein
MAKVEQCEVCGAVETALGMSRVVIEGRALTLCREHASIVASAMPETFDELRALFVGTALDRSPTDERRSPIPRRAPDDRRVFPPRLEGRRASAGRRASDADG